MKKKGETQAEVKQSVSVLSVLWLGDEKSVEVIMVAVLNNG